jgi:hypothetical protein
LPDKADLVRVSFPKSTWVALALFALLMLGGIYVQLGVVEDQRRTNRDQRALIRKQVREALPLIREAEPLVRETRQGLPESRRLARRGGRLAEEATPLVGGLRVLTDVLLSSDVGSATRAARDLAIGLVGADLPGTSRALAFTADELLYRYRLRRLVVGTLRAQKETSRLNLLRKSARAAEIAPDLLAVQRKTLAVQKQTLALQTRQLRVAGQTLSQATRGADHAESLDRKTGGPAPGVPGTGTRAP